jgi:translation elongation factor EF-1alpha
MSSCTVLLLKESAEAGKGSFALAWVLDEGSSEREHGVAISDSIDVRPGQTN